MTEEKDSWNPVFALSLIVMTTQFAAAAAAVSSRNLNQTKVILCSSWHASGTGNHVPGRGGAVQKCQCRSAIGSGSVRPNIVSAEYFGQIHEIDKIFIQNSFGIFRMSYFSQNIYIFWPKSIVFLAQVPYMATELH